MKKTIGILLGAIVLISALIASKEEPKKTPQVGASGFTKEQTDALKNEEPLFAEINPSTGEVLRVIVISQENIDTGKWGNPNNWIRTSKSGVIKKNGASIGDFYDFSRDAFISPKTFEDQIFDEATAQWKTPKKSATTT